jgi:hypothetical protein
MTTVSHQAFEFLFSIIELKIVCLHFFKGKKPRYKKWFICIPLHIKAVVKAVTHGIGTTSIQLIIASFIKTYQGSLIQGVQASLIKAIV